MLRFAANLSMMFTEVPFLDRFAAAAKAGFQGVEYLFPYEYPADTLAELLRRHNLENVLFNLSAGNWAAGERGLTCLPDRQEEFRSSVATALEYAAKLKVTRLHAMAGIRPAGADPAAIHATYIGNLKYAAAECAKQDITLLIEAINSRDMAGFYVNTLAQAYSVMQEVGAPNVKMQLDCYHMQVMEGDLVMKIRKYAPHCAHVQIAGAPERHEPDTGEIYYPYVFRALEDVGYAGWIGCEYRPAGKTVDGLGWLQTLPKAAVA